MNEAPNHALQRTGSAVTAPAADRHRLSTHRQVPRPLRLSLSLGFSPSSSLALDAWGEEAYIVVMKELRFEWDESKAEENLAKHGVSFGEACSVFHDERAVEFYDDEHSKWEDRFLLLGLSGNLRLLLVCHCHREGESVIRIISARKATKNEAKHYPR